MIPGLDPAAEKRQPRGSIDLGSGYLLLRAREDAKLPVESTAFGKALLEYGEARGLDVQGIEPDDVLVARWAGLQLPSGQRVRTVWKEKQRPAANDNYIRC